MEKHQNPMMILSQVSIHLQYTGKDDVEASESDNDTITSGHTPPEHRYS